MPIFINQVNALPYDRRTVDGVSAEVAPFSLGNNDLRFLLAVPVVSGTTPFLDLRIESKTISGNYVTIASFPRITEAGSHSLLVEKCPRTHRFSWSIGGTRAEFGFEVDVIYQQG